jgi:hypothetical protein
MSMQSRSKHPELQFLWLVAQVHIVNTWPSHQECASDLQHSQDKSKPDPGTIKEDRLLASPTRIRTKFIETQMTIKLGLQQELHGCKKGQLQLPASSHYCSDATTKPFLVAAQMLHLLHIQNDSSHLRQPILVLHSTELSADRSDHQVQISMSLIICFNPCGYLAVSSHLSSILCCCWKFCAQTYLPAYSRYLISTA